MKPNIGRIASILVVSLMLGAPIVTGSVMARKPGPTPPPEPTGTLEFTSSDQIVLQCAQYVRLYAWDDATDQFVHTWSGNMDSTTGWGGVAIGDVDNDGGREIVAAGSLRTGKGPKTVWTPFMKIWWEGDASDSPTLTLSFGCPTYFDICDIDRDGANELVMAYGGIRVWEVSKTGYTEVARLDFDTEMGLTEADADNDGELEIVAAFYGADAVGAVVEYDDVTDTYSLDYEIRPSEGRGPFDDFTVGDVDGDGANEVFGSGYIDGRIYLWRYDKDSDSYEQIWTTQGTDDFDASNEIADIDGCGVDEFMFCEGVATNLVLYKYDSTDGTWYKVGTWTGCPCGSADEMVSHDWDGDGADELVAQYSVWDWDGTDMVKIQTLAEATLVGIG